MKKRNYKQRCKNEKCYSVYEPVSKKSVFCSERCRGEHGREKRRERDKEFNLMTENQKKWYLTLLKFKSGSIVDLDTLRQFGLDKNYLPPAKYNKKKQIVISFGAVTLLQLHDDNYEIIHNVDTIGNNHYKSPDSKPILVETSEGTEEISHPEINKEENLILESARVIITEQQAKIVQLENNNQIFIDREKLNRQSAILLLIKRECLHISELLIFKPIIDKRNGTVNIDGFIFKHFFMRLKEYRFIGVV